MCLLNYIFFLRTLLWIISSINVFISVFVLFSGETGTKCWQTVSGYPHTEHTQRNDRSRDHTVGAAIRKSNQCPRTQRQKPGMNIPLLLNSLFIERFWWNSQVKSFWRQKNDLAWSWGKSLFPWIAQGNIPVPDQSQSSNISPKLVQLLRILWIFNGFTTVLLIVGVY